MAMLAEPRQRKRYNLVPRGKALYEDENRFGTKMLEKMGWKKGTGLGAKEDGSKDFIRLRYKNDVLGLGFEHRDDQWTQHEQSFNGLLKTLNNEKESSDTTTKRENSNESEDDIPRVGFGFSQTSVNEEKKPNAEKLKEKISGVSLEERSKQSRARVHYKKFTKGKDLAQYSEKDLANIFGKKAADEEQAINDFYQQLNSTLKKKPEQTKDGEEGPIKGVQIINTGVSVTDYFKTKMEALKNRKNGSENTENIADVDSNEQLEDNFIKKKKKKRKEKKDQDEVEEKAINTQNQKEDNSQIIYSSVSVTDYFKMKMEDLKNRKNSLNNSKNNDGNKNTCEEVISDEVSKKKKKKKKDSKDQNNVSNLEQAQDINTNTIESDEDNKKGKKSKKCDSVEMEENPIEENIKTKKKKDKRKKKPEEGTEQQNEQNDLSNENSITKKRKHNNTSDNTLSSNPVQELIEIDLTEEPRNKKQKKNKSKETESNEIIEINESENDSPKTTEDQNTLKGKKKKKSKSNIESNDSSDKVENTFNSNQTEKVSDQPSKKRSKAKRKEVSYNAKNVLISGVSIQELDLDELKEKYSAFNIYPISSFCAEKFRNISLTDFTGSTLPQIEGYSLGPDLQLDVKINKNDEERITNLWNCVLNKYSQLQKPKKTYQHYVREVIKARKTKQKRPKLYVKTWKRRNAFQVI